MPARRIRTQQRRCSGISKNALVAADVREGTALHCHAYNLPERRGGAPRPYRDARRRGRPPDTAGHAAQDGRRPHAETRRPSVYTPGRTPQRPRVTSCQSPAPAGGETAAISPAFAYLALNVEARQSIRRSRTAANPAMAQHYRNAQDTPPFHAFLRPVRAANKGAVQYNGGTLPSRPPVLAERTIGEPNL